jgi:hypothetical protein
MTPRTSITKPVNALLMLGIAVLPFIFAWPVLFGSYSSRAKQAAVFFLLFIGLAELMTALPVFTHLGGAVG